MTTHSLSTLLLAAVIAVLAPPLADLAGRKAPVPLVVFEILLGILVGPDVLGWAHDDDYAHALSQFGLAMLFAIGVERGTLKPSSVAAMVGAGMLSVLLYPFLALKVSGAMRTPQGPREAAESW